VSLLRQIEVAVANGKTTAQASKEALIRAVSRHGTVWGNGISEKVVWYVVRSCALRLELEHLAPHDLRRTCAKLCHVNGGELLQIQFRLGQASVLTTERYLGCKQNLEEPVNDRLGCLFSEVVDSR
jgi:site-specific recombinase XerD